MTVPTRALASHCTDLVVLKVFFVLKNTDCKIAVLSATNVRNYTANETEEHGIDRSVGLGKSALPTLVLSGFSFQNAIPRT